MALVRPGRKGLEFASLLRRQGGQVRQVDVVLNGFPADSASFPSVGRADHGLFVLLLVPADVRHQQQDMALHQAERPPSLLAVRDRLRSEMANGSAKARRAVSKLTPCLRRFAAALTGSQSAASSCGYITRFCCSMAPAAMRRAEIRVTLSFG